MAPGAAAAYKGTAAYLEGRVQGAPEQMPDFRARLSELLQAAPAPSDGAFPVRARRPSGGGGGAPPGLGEPPSPSRAREFNDGARPPEYRYGASRNSWGSHPSSSAFVAGAYDASRVVSRQ